MRPETPTTHLRALPDPDPFALDGDDVDGTEAQWGAPDATAIDAAAIDAAAIDVADAGPVGTPIPLDRARRRRATTATAAAVPSRGRWPARLEAVLTAEVARAREDGVLSAGEAEILVARLVLVIDQALAVDSR